MAVLTTKVESIDGAYISVSGRFRNGRLHVVMTFVYQPNDNIVVEWEPCHGAITTLVKCGADWKAGERSALPHHLLGWCTGYGNWSQLAVDECQLQTAFTSGDYTYIYGVLKKFSAM